MLTQDEALKEFEAASAILRGHFVLTSGLHSDTYLQCARVMMDPKRGERLCKGIADRLSKSPIMSKIDMVVSPAMGGVIVGYEVARQLGKQSIFCERVDGAFTVRRGFTFEPGTRFLMVEDVVTTGKSSNETIDCIEQRGGKVIGAACLINRSGGNPLNVPLVSLIELDIQTYTEEQLPFELAKIPAEKPGSRFLKQASGQ
ncbi:MAG: orotate phosphoribosyltransferase [Proteobacteria bacterium]|nr:orotate phosphoribosyltransferase [Pseudomonadota bacterium]